MIERVTHSRWPTPPQDNRPKAVTARWDRMKPLYDAVRNDEARGYEYARMEMLDASERSTTEKGWT